MLSAPATALDFVEEYAATAERFAVTVAASDLTSRVPACPTWSTYDMVVHVGNVHGWAATIVETGAAAAEQNDEPASRKPRAVSEWYAGKAEDLYEVLRTADLAAPCWNFAGINLTRGFWARRQLHEVGMHLVDLEQAERRTPLLSPTVCTDGIAEVFEVFLPRMHKRGYAAELTEPLTVQTIDTEHVWTLHPMHDAPPRVAVRTEPGADLVEGTAAAVWQLLWKRAPLDHPEVSYVGNRDRIAAFMDSRLTP
jgi:uncharacterized protein (TIGR03083 family)